MFATLLRRLRRQKSQRRAALIPPDLSLRDSFRSSFPRISDGGYSLYYELELLSRKRAYREAQNLRIPTTRKRIRASSHTRMQSAPGVFPSRPRRVPPPPIPLPSTSRRHRIPKRSRRNAEIGLGLDQIPEAPSGYHSVRKQKKGENLYIIFEQDGIKINASPFPSPKFWVMSQSSSSSSSSGHGTVDTPPTTVEDLAIGDDGLSTGALVNFQSRDDRSSYGDCGDARDDPIDRPESRSSYYTARSHFSDA